MRKILFSLTFLFSLHAVAVSLVRGPYLHSLTNNSVKIMWRTSDSTKSIVRYGNSPTSLTNIISDTIRKKNHIVKISGLNAKSKYFYSVGFDTVTLAGGRF